MKQTVRLFVQKHDNRTYTVSAPLFPDVSAYGPTLEECKLEMAEALAKKLAETPPQQLNQYALQQNQSLEKATVALRPTDQHGKRRREAIKLTVSLLLTPHDSGQILISVPRLRHPPLSFFIANHNELGEVAQLELIQYFHGESFETILAYQADRYETLDTIEVDFKAKRVSEQQDQEEDEHFWALKQSGTNLTAQAAEGQLRRAFRRESLIEQVLGAVAGERRPSVLLVGQSGVGKTAIVHEVARRIRRKEGPEILYDRHLWAVTGDSLIAGCSYIGQWQEKMTDLVKEVRKKRHLLFVEDVAALAEAGRHSKGDDNIADFLKPFMQTGDVILVGETSPERLRRLEQLSPGFVVQFRRIDVEPSGESDTQSILAAVAREVERTDDLRIEPGALEAAVELTNRFMPYRAQPGKAITLIEQISAEANRKRSTARPVIGRKDTIAGFTAQTGLPEFIVSDNVALDLAAVHSYFADRIIGQNDAVDAMVDLIAMVKAGLSDPEKPLGTFLFIGPTGVGKTQLAKTLASYLFGDARRMLRFDMSEYSDPAAVRRLIGVPGAGREGGEGELTRRVREQPFCVVLLDEFEKADSQIFDVLLQVLGEGRLTDATGQTISFQNAIIIMTSNLGASAREQRTIGLNLGDSGQTNGNNRAEADEPRAGVGTRVNSANYWQRRVEQHFRPEFVNRIDQIVAFRALDSNAMRQIARREIGDVLLREGFVRRNVLVEIDDNVIDLLLEQGFTATYGARPLKRAIERLLVLPLARFLAGRSNPSVDLLRLSRDNDTVALNAAQFSSDERSSTVTLEGSGGTLAKRRLDDRGLAEGFAELRRTLANWEEREAVVEMRNERATRLADTNKPTFWDDPDAARHTLARFYFLDRLLKRLQQLIDRAEYLEELAGLVHRQRDARYREELADGYERLVRDVAFLEVELLCAHLEDNHQAVLGITRLGNFTRDDGQQWASQLATVYLHWARRKGYDIDMFVLEAMPDEERNQNSLLGQHYPYRWRALDTSDIDALIKQVTALEDVSELAIGLQGTNVYGFLKGEKGAHRRNERRPSGERIQRWAQVDVHQTGQLDARAWLDKQLMQRAWLAQEQTATPKKERDSKQKQSDPQAVRVYQFDGERQVRDLRTQVRLNDIGAVLEGNLDDFILAYLRENESQGAWQEE